MSDEFEFKRSKQLYLSFETMISIKVTGKKSTSQVKGFKYILLVLGLIYIQQDFTVSCVHVERS